MGISLSTFRGIKPYQKFKQFDHVKFSEDYTPDYSEEEETAIKEHNITMILIGFSRNTGTYNAMYVDENEDIVPINVDERNIVASDEQNHVLRSLCDEYSHAHKFRSVFDKPKVDESLPESKKRKQQPTRVDLLEDRIASIEKELNLK